MRHAFCIILSFPAALIALHTAGCGQAGGDKAASSDTAPAAMPVPEDRYTESRGLPAWKTIFDGQTLAGWKEIGGGRWSVEDGSIVGQNGDGRYGWLIFEEPMADFVLELDCRIEAFGNSGIQFRSRVIDDVMIGYQAELDPRPTHGTGGVYEEKGRGWLRKPDARGLAAMKPMGQWNHYRIEAIGDHIRLAVNGVETVNFRDQQARSGIIALQVHSGSRPVKVRWRNIRLQDLGDGGGPQPPNAPEAPGG